VKALLSAQNASLVGKCGRWCILSRRKGEQSFILWRGSGRGVRVLKGGGEILRNLRSGRGNIGGGGNSFKIEMERFRGSH